jgi:glycosyltransferase involved in cell wall biosynthesis
MHLVESFGGGVYEMVVTLARGLAERGVTVCVAHGRRPETPADVAAAVGDDRVELFDLGWSSRRPGAQLAAARAARAVVAEWEPDVVHMHSSFAGFVGGLALPRERPLVYTPHAYAFELPGLPRSRRWAYLAAEHVVARRVTAIGAVSESEADTAQQRLRAANVVSVPNGIPDFDEPPEGGTGSGRAPLVVAMGRMDDQRLPAQTADILARVSYAADVHWIGGPKPGTGAEAPVAAAGVPFTGWLPRPEAMARMRRASVYLHWTAWDGYPLTLLEAVARGIAVVARETPVTREILGQHGVCTNPDDAVELTEALVADDGARARLAAAQRRSVGAGGAQRMAGAWLWLYTQLAP